MGAVKNKCLAMFITQQKNKDPREKVPKNFIKELNPRPSDASITKSRVLLNLDF